MKTYMISAIDKTVFDYVKGDYISVKEGIICICSLDDDIIAVIPSTSTIIKLAE